MVHKRSTQALLKRAAFTPPPGLEVLSQTDEVTFMSDQLGVPPPPPVWAPKACIVPPGYRFGSLQAKLRQLRACLDADRKSTGQAQVSEVHFSWHDQPIAKSETSWLQIPLDADVCIASKSLALRVAGIDTGACELTDGLKHCTSLQWLSLRDNQLGDAGACALARGLQHCTALEYLDLEDNPFGEDGKRALKDGWLKHCQNLVC